MNQKIRNFLIVSTAVILSVLLFLGVSQQRERPTLTALAESSTPLDVAMSNAKPTLLEFYANWCTSCQAMVSDLSDLKADYGDDVNFVMLNVDNRKWLPEMLRYEVDGIPQFVFFDQDGHDIAKTVGEQPRSIMGQNLAALVAQQPLPYLAGSSNISTIESDLNSSSSGSDDPRSHGGNPSRA